MIVDLQDACRGHSRHGAVALYGGSYLKWRSLSPTWELRTVRRSLSSDDQRLILLGFALGIPFGIVLLPFLLGALGMTMEFNW
jgi:hypothetical protein